MFARNYYISSSSGSNANAGTSPALAWRTLDKIYLKSPGFQPGDSILLKRGDVFDGQIRASVSGSTRSPIVIASYGASGTKPIIYGDLPTVSWVAVPGRSGYYKAYVGAGSIVAKGFEPTTAMTAKSEGALNLSNPTDLATFLNGFSPSTFGPNDGTDTIWVRTADGGLPNKIHLFRDANYIWPASHDAIIRDLDLRNVNVGLDINLCTNVTVRDISVKNTLNIGIYLRTGNNKCLVDSCTTDSTGYTAIYNLRSTRCIIRANTITNVVNTILGIPVIGERCAIGIQGSATAVYDVVGQNTIEYNVADKVADSGVDFFWNQDDTVRYNTFSGMTGGLYPNGTNLVIVGNTVTLANGGNGMNVVNNGPGQITVRNNTIRNASWYGIMGSIGGGGSTVVSGNLIESANPLCLLVDFETTGFSSSNNGFLGSGRFSQQGTPYSTLAAFQQATGQEQGSAFYSGPPTGVFTVTPDSLPAYGGTVTLTWSTTNANSATINPVIGNVATSGSKTATVTATTVFAITLAGPLGSVAYNASVVVKSSTLTEAQPDALPSEYVLRQNYPNPFNPSTTIEFNMPSSGYVSLKVFDSLGREIAILAQGIQSSGTHRFQWNPIGIASGVYFYRLTAGSYSETHRMMLIR